MPGPVTREVKKYLIQLIVGVVVLDAIMIGVYYGLSVPLKPERTQQSFVAIWVVLTLIVVATRMKKIRQARVRR
ncbi:MAG TPA: hypothetical protein VI259_25470 [Gemmatimonadaceae bacterium]